jgi:hypothetical protein
MKIKLSKKELNSLRRIIDIAHTSMELSLPSEFKKEIALCKHLSFIIDTELN